MLQASTANANGAGTFASSINLNGADRTIRSDQPGSLTSGGVGTFSGNITGSGGIIKAGPGHIYFTGSNSYDGITRVNNGTLTLGSISAAPGRNTPGKIIVAGGATLGVVGGSWGPITNLLSNVTWSDKTSRLGFMLVGGTSSTYSNVISQELSVHKYGSSTGALTLTGNSSYTGHTIVSQGILAFNSIANVGGGNSALGAPATVGFGTIALGGDNNAVTLRYTGTGHSTDRVINLSGTTGGVTLDTGTGALTFTSALTATGAGSKTLTLTGSTAGIGELGGAIVNNSGTNITSVTKTGSGTWVLSGPSSYTGNTTVSAGTLLINGNQTAATGNVSVAANATLGGTGTIGGNTTISANAKLAFDISTPAASHDKLDLAGSRSFTFSGASTLTITSTGGAGPGTYTLLTAPGGINGNAPATLNLPSGWAATVSVSGNSLLLNVTSTGGPGPVDHFVISAIASPQTVGTPITGITITAQDAANDTATSFTGKVTFGGTAGITGNSVDFVEGILSDVSVTPLNAGSDRTLTVVDGSGHVGSTIFTVQTTYAAWAGGYLPADVNNPAGNNDGDTLTNLQEFAFGMDPTSPNLGSLTYVADGDVTKPGTPVVENFASLGQAADYRAVFARRKDHVSSGLIYTVQFSADMGGWTASATTPTRLTGENSTGVLEAVSVPFPATVPLQGGGSSAPRFFRLATQVPQ